MFRFFKLGKNKEFKSKRITSIFASTDLIDVEFYKILNSKMQTLYVGQTIQGIGKRYDQHKIDPKKLEWSNKMKGVFEIDINDIPGPYKMTPYEAAVTELYEINKNGGMMKEKGKLYNKQKPIGKKKFEQFKKLGFNPCKFYV
ncbi:hypothetical protein M0M57_10855 [Flavobacterium azooxidireducens]|uniref:GIY-YIG domain-containing protein n=1 Tax=Flavobacterium azooxidireducens TaxID=1871076 RepID=A0ABY4KBD8_9FLAO|nr:hypothetical protein [Flavobacterium azooxidireducens]UPQ78122.1 hypothetical protein M0M57_10855 [Flavobacterium azooxidireducens]